VTSEGWEESLNGARLGELGDGRVQLPDGRIVRPTVVAGDLAVIDSEPAAREPRRVLFYNPDGPVYEGDTGIPVNGLLRHTRYPASGPSWARNEDGSPLSYSFDSTGQPFWRAGTGTVMSIPAPYALPKLFDLQGEAFWSGIKHGVINLPSDLATGVADLVRGNFTVDSLLAGAVQNSPVGVLMSMAGDGYFEAGRGIVGTGAGLATGGAIGSGVSVLGRSWTRAAYGLDALAPDVRANPFLADDARSVPASGLAAQSGLPFASRVFSGHGAYEIGSGVAVVPSGTSLTIYSKFGATITDRLGNVVETAGDLSKVYSRTYGPGDRLPNYTLYPPEGLNLQGNPVTVSTPTRVSDLLKTGMGECHWAACTYNWRASNSELVFDTVGIRNNQTKQWITIYSKD
jgi:hypothetical protein